MLRLGPQYTAQEWLQTSNNSAAGCQPSMYTHIYEIYLLDE